MKTAVPDLKPVRVGCVWHLIRRSPLWGWPRRVALCGFVPNSKGWTDAPYVKGRNLSLAKECAGCQKKRLAITKVTPPRGV